MRTHRIGMAALALLLVGISPVAARQQDETGIARLRAGMGSDDRSAPLPPDNSLGLSAAPRNCDKRGGMQNGIFDGNGDGSGECAGQCDSEGCNFCGQCFCGPPSRAWIRGEYLLWWTNGVTLPPLVTQGVATATSPGPGTSATDPAGAIGTAGTSVIFGGNTIAGDVRSGWRISGGLWLDRCQQIGIAADYFDLGQQPTHFSASSNGAGNPVLARPFYDVENARQWRELVSYPGTLAGTVSVDAHDFFQSTGAWMVLNLCSCQSCGCSPCSCDSCGDGCGSCGSGGSGGVLKTSRVNLLVGYRYYHLADDLQINENLTAIPAPITGFTSLVNDTFRANNSFNGAEIGFDAETTRGRFSLEMMLKAAIGNNHATYSIGGHTTNTNFPPTDSITDVGGLLALPTNIGTYSRDQFTVIPQLRLDVGYQITCRMRAYVGYDLIYWACVARAPNAIDFNVDPRNVPGGADETAPTHFPEFRFTESSFWAQGMHGGLELRF